MADQNLSHEELWDDSELVDTWNEAVEEYKKYHSLAARGEKVPLEPSQPPLQSKAAAHLAPNGPAKKPSNIPANFTPATKSSQPQAQSQPANPPPIIGPALPPAAAPAPPSLASLPQTFLGSGAQLPAIHVIRESMTLNSTGHDENLRNIMMSWYYAGYYTGLYEGQQKAYAEMQDSLQNEGADG